MKKNLYCLENHLSFYLAIGLFILLIPQVFSQASPGPYEILPLEEAFIIEAWMDLLEGTTSNKADWSGFIGPFWESPNAYSGHYGTDFSLDTGTPLYAPADGVVTEIYNEVPENNHTINAFGNYVRMRITSGISPNGETLDVLLAHQLPMIQVSVGQEVVTGQLLGYSDNTGNSTSEHLHFESLLTGESTGLCPFYNGHFKYPIMFNPALNKQVGHIIRVTAQNTPIRSDRFLTSPQISTAYQDQLYFCSYWKRGVYRVFIPNDTANRSGWILALDAEEVFTGTVIQALPDPVDYEHEVTLLNPYPIKSLPDSGSASIGQIVYGGGRFVADQVQGGWYRIPIPESATWGWVHPDNRMIVYPELYNPDINLNNLPNRELPQVDFFTTVGKSTFGRSKYNRSYVYEFTPSSPGGDGKALLITDAIIRGNAYEECISVGKVNHRNYYIQCDVYLDYQPDYFGSSEYQICGVFARDDGFSSMDQTFEGKGNCYVLYFNSKDGGIHAGKFVDADLTDFMPSPMYITTDGWNNFRIDVQDDHIRYYLNTQLLVDQVDVEFPCGPGGIGYSYHGKNYPPERGVYFDNFIADEVSPTPTPTPAPDIPAAPSNLTATAVSSSQIDLAWEDNSDNEDNFIIERKQGKSAFEEIDTVPMDTTTYNDTGLSRNTSYTYRVKARNDAGDSEYSNEATAKTLK